MAYPKTEMAFTYNWIAWITMWRSIGYYCERSQWTNAIGW